MPILSMFFGIIIKMYNRSEHNPPHFHAKYQDYEASFDMDGKVIEGQFPKKQEKLVAAWVELHRDELLANWELAINKQTLYKIDPLK